MPPVITPVDFDGSLDKRAFEKLLEKLGAAGLPALFLCGTAGIGPSLDDRVYADVLETAVETLGDSSNLLAGVMEPSTDRTVERIRLAGRIGCRYCVVCPPYFFSPHSEIEFFAHFQRCAEATSMGIIAYNLPQYTSGYLPVETVMDLWETGAVCGIKESSGDNTYFESLCFAAREKGLPVFQGNRPEFQKLHEIQAAGAVPVPANAAPAPYLEAWEKVSTGEPVDGLQAECDELWEELVSGTDSLSGTQKKLAAEGIGKGILPMPLT